jgi:hypothetical protein
MACSDVEAPSPGPLLQAKLAIAREPKAKARRAAFDDETRMVRSFYVAPPKVPAREIEDDD